MATTTINKAVNEFNQQVKPVSLWADAWRRLAKNRMALIALWIVVIYAAVGLLAPILPIFDYSHQEIMFQNIPPSLRPAGEVAVDQATKKLDQLRALVASGRNDLQDDLTKATSDLEALKVMVQSDPAANNVYILGTDYLGRDMLARTIYGGRISMLVGLVGTITAMLIGVIFGAIAGYVGGRADNLMMRFVDIMYSLPYMLIVIIMMSMFNRSGAIVIIFVAIALVSWLTIARVVRGQVISLKNAEFIEAARCMGAGPIRIIFKYLLPNILGVIIIFTTLSIPSFIMSESFLSYLGLGISAPLASWGTLVSDGVQGMELYPWRLLVPAITMTVFLFAMNFLGDGLRDAFDPQSKNRA